MRMPPNARQIATRNISGNRWIGGSRRAGAGSATTSTAQCCDVGGIAFRSASEYRGAGNEHVGAGVHSLARGLRIDAAIDLERDIASGFCDACGNRLDLLQLAGDEGLAAEARIDAHHQNQVDQIDEVVDGVDRSPRIEHDTRSLAERSDELKRAM